MVRLDRLKALAEKKSADPFPLYGLAMEYKKLGRLDEALDTFARLIQLAPDYLPACFHYGSCLIEKGDEAAAERVLRRGLSLAEKAHDTRTHDELLSVLNEIVP